MTKATISIALFACFFAACGPDEAQSQPVAQSQVAIQPTTFDFSLVLYRIDGAVSDFDYYVDGKAVGAGALPSALATETLAKAASAPLPARSFLVRDKSGKVVAGPFAWGPPSCGRIAELVSEKHYAVVRSKKGRVYVTTRTCEYANGKTSAEFYHYHFPDKPKPAGVSGP